MKLVILSFNHPEITSRAVRSALMHFSAADILLVHNGSLKKHYELLQKDFSSIQHLIIEENKGYSGGANAGLRQAFKTHDWVLFLTNDCEIVSRPQKPNGVLSVPLIRYKRSGQVDSVGGVLNLRQGRLRHFKAVEDWQNLKSYERLYVPGSAFLLHKNLFEQTSGFDESLHTFWEDVDWSLRMQEKGVSFSFDPHFVIDHAGGKTTRKDPYYTNFLFKRNRKKVSRRWCRNFLDRVYLELNLLK